MKRVVIRYVLLGLLLSPGLAPLPARGAADGAVLARLRVVGDEGAAAARGGIPIPRDLGVHDPAELGIARETRGADGTLRRTPLTVQWRVLSRWGGEVEDTTHAVRWVLADVDATPRDDLVLTRGGAVPAAGPSLGFETEDGVVLDDGRLELRVPRTRFAPLARTRLRRSDFDVAAATALTDQGVGVELAIRDAAGERQVLRPSVEDVVLEESGPLRAMVLVRGGLGGADGGDGAALWPGGVVVELRATVVRGTAGVDLEWTLVNGSERPLDVLGWRVRVPTRWNGPVTCRAADADVVAQSVALTQVSRPPAAGRAAFAYEFAVDGSVHATGTRSVGTLLLTDGERALRIVVARFWESSPKSVVFAGGEIDVDLLPQDGASRCVGAGRSVTAGLRLELDPTAGGRAARSRVGALVPDSAWVSASGVMAPLAPFEGDVGDDVRNAAVRHLERLQQGLIDVAVCDAQGPTGLVPPASIATQREVRGGANAAYPYGVDLYGWDRYGELVDAGGLSQGMHAWVDGLGRAYLARHDRRFLDAARLLAEPRLASAGAVAARGTSLRGLLLLHGLTGDGRVLAAARTIAERLLAAPSAPGDAIRIDALLAFFEHTGDGAALRGARAGFAELLAAGERRGDRVALRDDVRALDGLIAVHRVTGDARALAELLRRLRRIWDVGYAGTGRVLGERYLPLQLHDPAGTLPLGFPAGLAVADALAYAHAATGVAVYLGRARAVFRDAVLFLQAPPMQFVAAGYHAPVGAAPARYPGREIAFGEFVLGGAPWLVSGDARLVAADVGVAETAERVVAQTALATRRPSRGAAVPAEGPGAAEQPVSAEPAGERADSRIVSEVVVDDADATLRGSWRTVRMSRALGGGESVARPRDTVATAQFRMTPTWDGRGRVYVLRRPVAGVEGLAMAIVHAPSGVARAALRPAGDVGRWQLIGEFVVRRSSPLVVVLECGPGRGDFAVDAVKLVRVP